MLDRITGKVVAIEDDAAVIEAGGLGYRAMMTTTDLATIPKQVTVYTVMHIRDGEESLLYGFTSARGREMFKSLTSVSKVGGKLALAILSFHGVEGTERVIVNADDKSLFLVSGVGKKTAANIIIELRDKLGAPETDISTLVASRPALSEVSAILKQMGFSAQEIADAVKQLPPDGDTETLLRHALKSLGPASQNA